MRGIWLAIALLLSACSTTQWYDEPTHGAWQVSGKIGLRQGAQRHNATFSWLQAQSRYRAMLSGPLGQGSAIIDGEGQHGTLTAEGQQWYSADLEQLLAQQTGWPIPLYSLPYWLQGRADPSYPQHVLSAQQFVQRGWQITWEGNTSPQRLRLEQEEAQITLIIKRQQTF